MAPTDPTELVDLRSAVPPIVRKMCRIRAAQIGVTMSEYVSELIQTDYANAKAHELLKNRGPDAA
jgi:hypothetical protein